MLSSPGVSAGTFRRRGGNGSPADHIASARLDVPSVFSWRLAAAGSARRAALTRGQMKSWMSALAAMSMKLAAPRVGCTPSMKSDVFNP